MGCGGTYICVYTGVNYGGSVKDMLERPNGTCDKFAGTYLSYKSVSANYEGYFYSGSNCTGSAKAAPRHSGGNMGFIARSFKHACVSCRTTSPQE